MMNPTIERLLSHTSIRNYSDRPVEPETLDLLLQVGVRAPSAGSNAQYITKTVYTPERMREWGRLVLKNIRGAGYDI